MDKFLRINLHFGDEVFINIDNAFEYLEDEIEEEDDR